MHDAFFNAVIKKDNIGETGDPRVSGSVQFFLSISYCVQIS